MCPTPTDGFGTEDQASAARKTASRSKLACDAEAVREWLKIRLENWLKHQFEGGLDHSIPHSGDT